MSSTLPAGEHKSEAKIPSTPIVKLADFLKEESVIDGSPLELETTNHCLSHATVLLNYSFSFQRAMERWQQQQAASSN